MRKVNFTETVLRDANQSLIATRLPYSKFEPILETIDKAGYYSAEVWGGATFDVCLRYLGETAQDPRQDAQHQAADAAAGPEHPGL